MRYFVRTLSVMALVVALALPAQATTIPSVASGEASSREAALNAALRHAVEQVVGMSVDTNTYVSNLSSIQDKIYTAATGYIESYEVLSEQKQPDGTTRITVSAKIAKERLASAVSPLVGNKPVELDGKIAIANTQLEVDNQKSVERQLKALLDEFRNEALKFSFKTRAERSLEAPTLTRVYLDGLAAEADQGWYARFRQLMSSIESQPYLENARAHACSYLTTGAPDKYATPQRHLLAELYNAQGELIERHRIQHHSGSGSEDMGDVIRDLPGPLGVFNSIHPYRPTLGPVPPPIHIYGAHDGGKYFVSVENRILSHVASIRVVSAPLHVWPVSLE